MNTSSEVLLTFIITVVVFVNCVIFMSRRGWLPALFEQHEVQSAIGSSRNALINPNTSQTRFVPKHFRSNYEELRKIPGPPSIINAKYPQPVTQGDV